MITVRSYSVQAFNPVQQLQWENEAALVIGVQRRMQQVPASLLSITVFRGESFIIQELQPVKDSIKFKLLKDDYRDMYQVISDMAMLTASAQLRSSGMQGSGTIDDLMAFGADQGWQEAIIGYACAYAKKNKRYYQLFIKEHQEGKYGKN